MPLTASRLVCIVALIPLATADPLISQSITAVDTVIVGQVPMPAQRGVLTVPESRADPERRTIELGYLRFPGLSPDPGPPTFWLAGGPGISGATDIGNAAHVVMALRATGDVVVVDQRGSRGSRSSLECPERWERPLDRPGSWNLIISHLRATVERCVGMLAGEGVDISAYNTTESADDIEDLRQALGYEQINLFATSYGTHLGMEVLRRHGSSVERAVFAAFYWQVGAPGANASIRDVLSPIFGRIRADTLASRRLPEPMRLVDSLLVELEGRPATIDLAATGPGDTTRLVLGRFDAEQALMSGMSLRSNVTRWLVRTLTDVAEGDLTRLTRGVSRGGRVNAMAIAVGCGEGFWVPQLHGICSVVPHLDRATQFQRFFTSDVPILFVAGTMDVDLATVSAWREYLSASEVLVLENGFHDDYYSFWPLYGDRVLRFLAGRSVDGERVRLPFAFSFESTG